MPGTAFAQSASTSTIAFSQGINFQYLFYLLIQTKKYSTGLLSKREPPSVGCDAVWGHYSASFPAVREEGVCTRNGMGGNSSYWRHTLWRLL